MELDRVGVIIPALNEEKAIAKVLGDLPRGLAAVIVADNGSTDETAQIARRNGAQVVVEPERGYGAACLKGIAALPETVDIVAFVDGDYSDYPQDLPRLAGPVCSGQAELVIGSRVLGTREAGSLTLPQRFGNWLATRLIGLIWGVRFSDLGPFRVIDRRALEGLAMADRDFGWTVEMQVKAAEQGLACLEVPVRYRRRIGHSKISGTVSGTVRAGIKILSIIFIRALKSQGRQREADAP